MPIQTYLTQLRQTHATGTATEHTHRPALATLLHALDPGHIQAINEPRRIACGAPDLAVLKDGFLVGHIEAKDIGSALDPIACSAQLQRYRNALPNLILTDYIEFRWYIDGAHRQTARLAGLDQRGRLKTEPDGAAAVSALLRDFTAHTPQAIATPRALAARLARLAHLIREIIVTAFETQRASQTLRDWRQAFAQVLIAELEQPKHIAQFADMFAQTLAYGLFSARVMLPLGKTFARHTAQKLIPKTNPFLHKFFYQITGPDLDDEPYAGFVNDLIQVLAHADMDAILTNFGQRTQQNDPTVHFYETFLAAYDPALRARRGVYYTPTPVVSFIVRSVDTLLKDRFGLTEGLADTHTLMVAGEETPQVLILDPATGTGTFLYAVIDHIRAQYMTHNNAGMWSSFVHQHLLPRILGFELLMAPYAVAHFKLALQLAGHDLTPELRAQWAYDFRSDERLGIYLTNTLEGPYKPSGLPLFTQFLAQENAAANEIKQDAPIMVIIGNPPYAVSSSNQGDYIENLMALYKTAVRGARNIQPLSDDYIKFIRFAHDRIERTGYGILGFITNHSYLSGLIHRGMREELLKTFNEIYLVNLHGNALLGETPPAGGKDENVFDIRQGMAITLMIKTGQGQGLATVRYADLWGKRKDKYHMLNTHAVNTLTWETLQPRAPHYFFVPKDFSFQVEYERGQLISDIYVEFTTGTGTGRDSTLVAFNNEGLEKLTRDLVDSQITDQTITERYNIKNTSGWNFFDRRTAILGTDLRPDIIDYHYRPFDIRSVLYNPIIRRDSKLIMQHMRLENVGLLVSQQQAITGFYHVLCTQSVVDESVLSTKTRERSFVFPLYLYPESDTTIFDNVATSPWPPDPAHGHRVPNLTPAFVKAMETALGLPFNPIQRHAERAQRGAESFTPADILAYIYTVFHSPTYRQRYAEFLKIDFPRVPLTSDINLFWQLVDLGRELISLHLDLSDLSGSRKLDRSTTITYPIAGNNEVLQRGGYPKYTPPNPAQDSGGRVHINKSQYFAGITKNVWTFRIGGYQVLRKWLKDRRGRTLTFNDLTHYPKIIRALHHTRHLMEDIDRAIPEWPLT